MKIAVPREIKPMEGRVALVPQACVELVRHGHQITVQSGAGVASGYTDEDYRAAGAQILPDARSLYGAGELVVKVKEPYGSEPELLRDNQLLFCFLHLAAEPVLSRKLLRAGVTAVAFETVQEPDGRLPILMPMSAIAGRIAIQVGTTLLEAPQGGKGLLLGGVMAARRGRVTVLGAGNAGANATSMAASMGAEVTVFDRDPRKLDAMRDLGPNVTALYPFADSLSEAVASSDLLVGAVLVPGARATRVVGAAQLGRMERGSVVVDISVDQGGCVETTRPTSWKSPTYQVNGITHFAVTNMPGAVPRTSSMALCASLMPYLLQLAGPDWRDRPALVRGLNLERGKLVHPALR
jgi:alanine dehydrogenase